MPRGAAVEELLAELHPGRPEMATLCWIHEGGGVAAGITAGLLPMQVMRKVRWPPLSKECGGPMPSTPLGGSRGTQGKSGTRARLGAGSGAVASPSGGRATWHTGDPRDLG